MLSLEQQNLLRERYRQVRPGWRPATERYAELVRERLGPEGRLLDIGCGRGGLVEQLEHPVARVVGVDADFRSLAEHRLATAAPPMPRAVTDAGLLPFASRSFDLVVASWVLEHLRDPAEVLGQVRRVLRPGGAFLFITPNKRHPLLAFNRLAARFRGLQRRLVATIYGRAGSDTFPAYYRANSAKDLGELAVAAQLEMELLQMVDDPTYLAMRPALFGLAWRLESRLPQDRQVHLVGIMRRPEA